MSVLMYIWQLPQHLLGLLLLLTFKGQRESYKGVTYYYCKRLKGGISLGKYILLGNHREKDIFHEYGHCKQSLRLGWLYLLVIGVPSLVWATIYGRATRQTLNGYYKFYTERWADKLGGVER